MTWYNRLRRWAHIARRKRRAQARLKDALRRHHSAGRDRGWQFDYIVGWVRARGPRDIFLCHPPSGAPFVAKVYGERHFAKRSHTVLEQTTAFTDLHVAPLFVDEATGVLAMDYAGERSLADGLSDTTRDDVARTAGAWLRRYHRDAFVEKCGHVPVPQLISDAPEDGYLTRATALHAAQEDRAAGLPTELVYRFGDFTPDNLMLGNQGLIAIDRAAHITAERETDMAVFLCWVDRHLFDATKTAQHREQRRAACRAAFVEGYGLTELGGPLLDAAIDTVVLRNWLHFRKAPRMAAHHKAYYDDRLAEMSDRLQTRLDPK